MDLGSVIHSTGKTTCLWPAIWLLKICILFLDSSSRAVSQIFIPGIFIKSSLSDAYRVHLVILKNLQKPSFMNSMCWIAIGGTFASHTLSKSQSFHFQSLFFFILMVAIWKFLVQMGRAWVSNPPSISCLWILYLLHLLSASIEVEAKWLGWKLCTRLFLHCSTLVGRPGDLKRIWKLDYSISVAWAEIHSPMRVFDFVADSCIYKGLYSVLTQWLY